MFFAFCLFHLFLYIFIHMLQTMSGLLRPWTQCFQLVETWCSQTYQTVSLNCYWRVSWLQTQLTLFTIFMLWCSIYVTMYRPCIEYYYFCIVKDLTAWRRTRSWGSLLWIPTFLCCKESSANCHSASFKSSAGCVFSAHSQEQ